MGDEGITSAQVEGFTVETNSGESREEITKSLQDDKSAEEKPDLGAAASELGKKGGKAAAKARKEAAKEAEAGEDAKADTATPEDKQAKAEEGDTEADAEEGKKDDEKPEKKLGKPRHDPKARMLEATRKEAEAKRDRDAAIARAQALEERVKALEGSQPQKGNDGPSERLGTAPDDARPKVDDFDSYEAYLDARDDFNRKTWTKELTEEQSRRQATESADRQLMGHIEKFRGAVAENLDSFSQDVLELKTEFQLQQGETPNGSNWLANELVFSPEHAPALMLHFSEHPDELQRIAALTTPRAVSREMAKLEIRLEAASSGTPRSEREEVSRAHPPVKPVSGAPSIADGTPSPKEGESFDSWYSRTGGKRVSAHR